MILLSVALLKEHRVLVRILPNPHILHRQAFQILRIARVFPGLFYLFMNLSDVLIAWIGKIPSLYDVSIDTLSPLLSDLGFILKLEKL